MHGHHLPSEGSSLQDRKCLLSTESLLVVRHVQVLNQPRRPTAARPTPGLLLFIRAAAVGIRASWCYFGRDAEGTEDTALVGRWAHHSASLSGTEATSCRVAAEGVQLCVVASLPLSQVWSFDPRREAALWPCARRRPGAG